MNRKTMLYLGCTAAIIALFTSCNGSETKSAKKKVSYLTAKVTTGSVVQTVSATGTIEPEELVDIGAQVSGKILSFGKDSKGNDLDYCSTVTNGMLLAKIDDVTYLADLDVARAQLQKSKASVEVAKAQVLQAQVKAYQAQREWERAQKIGVGIAMSQTTYDNYQSTFETALAAFEVAKAQQLQSEASVIEATASVEKAERNLSYCEIVSSVDGIVIDRRVNVGQTVVSSMSASSLFLVARDLKKVQIWVAVNEADIGSIKEGGHVTFTVDTFPGRTFEGVVKRIRLNATVSSNVVTYTVEVETDNSDGTLLPFLTANVLFETARADNGVIVPAKALRFRPEGVPPEPGDAVYVKDKNGKLTRIPVTVLLSNGLDASVKGEGLSAGMDIVTMAVKSAGGSKAAPGGAPDGEKNPFMPSMPKPPKKGAGAPPPPH